MKFIQYILYLGLFSFIFIGCSDNETDKIKTVINSKFKRINNSEVGILLKTSNDIHKNFDRISSYTICLAKKNPNIKDTLLQLNIKNKKIASDLSAFQKSIDISETTKFNKSLKEAEGNKVAFQKILQSFKQRLIKMNNPLLSKEILYVMFDGAVKEATTEQEFLNSLMLNVAIQNIALPLEQQYPVESKSCVKKISGLYPLKKIQDINISSDNSSASVNVLLDKPLNPNKDVTDTTNTLIINLKKINNVWTIID